MLNGLKTTTFGFMGLFVLVGLLMVHGAFDQAYAGGNPGPGEGDKVRGFALQAIIMGFNPPVGVVLPVNTFSLWAVVGACKGVPFAIGPVPLNFPVDPNATEDDILFWEFSGGGPPGCYSTTGGEDLIITNVQKFNNTGTEMGAEIHLQEITSGN